MQFTSFKSKILLLVIIIIGCGNKNISSQSSHEISSDLITKKLLVAANQTEKYLPLLKNKKIAIVANQTSVIFRNSDNNYVHLVDSLVRLKQNIQKVFAPEHGFRGKADAGETVKDGIDTKTGLPIVSLYGKNKKPSAQQLEGIDMVIFDIQDVGARFYTYISSLHYVMEACAENRIPLLVLDRPNPNGHYIDGPILEMQHQSFVGMHPIPVVHGMTIGEYAKMINGEKWLQQKIQCELTVIPVANYNRNNSYHLPIKPSPNLPNDKSINLYPSLCFFEGTNVNAGRGTTKQFQIYGSPYLPQNGFAYTPISRPGAKYPKHQNKKCFGEDLSQEAALSNIRLNWLTQAYQKTKNKEQFFNKFFTKLAGTKSLQKQIEAGMDEKEIKKTWQKGLQEFQKTRSKYLLYPM
ncbi:MAG: DUF1343 domain-containing protein [Flavobacteriaceae bacterium]|nr:DUF1343 domain-containing protein [Flavobacteriaceae bacterium]